MSRWQHARPLVAATAWVTVTLLTACSNAAVPAPSIQQDSFALPAPRLESEVSLEQALSTRHSVRSFSTRVLAWTEIGQLLWAAQGITRDWGARTAPSAGAMYPLDVYVSTATGVYHYLPQGHQVVATQSADAREGLWQAGLKQDAIRRAPAVFVITATYERTSGKYGDRAVRYVHLEAGHAAQNILLQAVALGLGGVPIGAFDDAEVQTILGLPEVEKPLYLIPVGYPQD
jgi:SagB-type dehydrogenase family enzyme